MTGFRVSPQQERALSAEHRRAVVQCAAWLSGELREDQVRPGLDAIVARHEILRTTFPTQVGVRGRSQVILEALAPHWSTGPAAGAGDIAAAAQLLDRDAEEPFDLERGPLLRVLLFAGSEQRTLLALTAHAACADAQTLIALLSELESALGGGEQTEDPLQYADYAEWRHELLAGEDEAVAAGRAFWDAQREGAENIPRLLFASAGAPGDASRQLAIDFSPAQLDALRTGARASGVEVPVFLEACWHALQARLSSEDALVLPGWVSGRAQPDLVGAVGPYAQPVPIRSRIDATTFAEVVDQINRARAEAESRQDLASGFQLCAIDGEPGGFAALELADGAPEFARIDPSAGMTLLLVAVTQGERIWVHLVHDTQAHDDQDAAQIAASFSALALSAASDPARPVAELVLLDEQARARALDAAAGPSPHPDASTPVHVLFQRAVKKDGSRLALTAGSSELSYAELNRKANRLAHFLRAQGVAPGEAVGLCLERTPALMVALLGILKSGGAYLPLNQEHPPARLAHQLVQAGARVLVTQEQLLGQLPEFAGELVCVDRDADRLASYGDEDLAPVSSLDDLAYVMYTSGSTGAPKGVAVTHGNLANYCSQMAARLDADGAEARFGVVSSISTDLGHTCIFPPLIAGGSVQLLSTGASMAAGPFALELGDRRLDVLKITPSHLSALLADEGGAAVLPRQWLLVGGEALRWSLVERVRSLAPECRLINHYGPTETTIGCCTYDVGERREDSSTVPIGRPLGGLRGYVLDAALQPVPPGAPGELCIGGAGVAAGYVGRAPGDQGGFIDDPFAPGHMYRTGDRVRTLRDGAIEFLGRVDDQVKVRGYRIEPGEVEAALLRHSAVRQAVVLAEPDDRGENRLVAYLVASGEPSVEELQALLLESLPEYMLPSRFATLDSLPYTPSGKVDRRALPDAAAVQTRREAQYTAPRDPVEEEIAGIWAELLGVAQVGVHDDFFALGGHSLLATQAIMRIRRLHGDIPLRALLAAPTVAALAEVVRGAGKPS